MVTAPLSADARKRPTRRDHQLESELIEGFKPSKPTNVHQHLHWHTSLTFFKGISYGRSEKIGFN